MANTQKNTKETKRTFNPKLFLKRIGLVFLCVYVCLTIIEQQKKINENLMFIQEYNQKIADANTYNADLKAQLAQIDSDRYLEQIAREKLKLAKPGDRIFIDSSKIK